MDTGAVYVGLDYHQSSIQVCVVGADGGVLRNRSVPNTMGDVARVVSGLGTIGAVTIGACCGAADLAETLRRDAGWPVELAHAGYVQRMKGNPDKSDYTDARLLAELGRTGFVPRVWLAPRPIRELRGLVTYRQQLVNERRAVKTRLLAVLREHRARPDEPLRRWSRAWLGWLETTAALGEHPRWIIQRHLEHLERLTLDILSVEARLSAATKGDPVVKKLLEQRGIGPVTAWMLRAHVGWFDRFRTGKQLARHCGLTPCNASSGTKQRDAGMVRGGDPYLKAVLIEAAHRLKRLEPRWAAFAAKLRRRGKPSGVLTVAIANRWVRRLFHEMKGMGPAPAPGQEVKAAA